MLYWSDALDALLGGMKKQRALLQDHHAVNIVHRDCDFDVISAAWGTDCPVCVSARNG